MIYALFFLGAFVSFMFGAQFGYQYGLNQVELMLKSLLVLQKEKDNESTKENM